MNALVEWNYASVGYENGWLQSVVLSFVVDVLK